LRTALPSFFLHRCVEHQKGHFVGTFLSKKSEFSRNLSENCELEVLNVHCGLRAPHPDLRN
jgi:hypothetical protein